MIHKAKINFQSYLSRVQTSTVSSEGTQRKRSDKQFPASVPWQLWCPSECWEEVSLGHEWKELIKNPNPTSCTWSHALCDKVFTLCCKAWMRRLIVRTERLADIQSSFCNWRGEAHATGIQIFQVSSYFSVFRDAFLRLTFSGIHELIPLRFSFISFICFMFHMWKKQH